MVSAINRYAELFPPGSPVAVKQTVLTLDGHRQPTETSTVGVVEEWADLPTGSWYAHGKNDRLWLQRLKLRKVDGEVTLMVIDDLTTIARLEAVRN